MRSNASKTNPISHAAELLEDGGLEHLTVRALEKLASPALAAGSLIFFRRGLDPASSPSPRAIRGVTLRFAGINDAALLGTNDPVRTREMARRLECGDLCCIGLDEAGAVVHHRWVSLQPTHIPELDRYFVPQPGEVYFYDLLTRPAFRGLGIDTHSRLMVHARLSQSNTHTVHCYVRADNPTGLLVARKWYKEVTRIWYLTIRGARPIVLGAGRLDRIQRRPEL